ncbi:MAG: hypothetical protein ABII90_06665 [Bacteroidota bacterium]
MGKIKGGRKMEINQQTQLLIEENERLKKEIQKTYERITLTKTGRLIRHAVEKKQAYRDTNFNAALRQG